MDNLLLHPISRSQLVGFAAAPSHALLILAPEGSGKRSVAESLAGQLLGIEHEGNWHEKPGIIYVEAENKSILIDTIRGLQKRLQLKTIGRQPIRRVVIIEAAHRMTTEAQNALLKMLEEPPADTVFILTALSKDSVLPTIYSRSQHIELKRPISKDVTTYFSGQGHASEDIRRALRYSGNRVGLAHALLKHSDNHPLLVTTTAARQLLGMPVFERLGHVDEWTRNKEELPNLLDSLLNLCRAGLTHAAEKGQGSVIKRWQRYYQAVYDAQAALSYTPNTKLLLTNLFLRLS